MCWFALVNARFLTYWVEPVPVRELWSHREPERGNFPSQAKQQQHIFGKGRHRASRSRQDYTELPLDLLIIRLVAEELANLQP